MQCHSSSFSRAPFRVALVLLALVSSYTPAPVVAEDGLSTSTPVPETVGPPTSLESIPFDAVDGKIVVDVFTTTVAYGKLQRNRVSARDGLKWTIDQGTAILSEDPFTGLSLFQPSGTVPVLATPRLGALSGTQDVIGLSPSIIPIAERLFQAAGGGDCQSSGGLTLNIPVRAIMPERVIPRSLGERALVYDHGMYFAFNPSVGLMRITYNPEQISETVLRSLNPPSTPSDPFFPASAESRFFFIIEMMSSGVSVFNKEPMVFTAPSTTWPPFQTSVNMAAPVVFYLVSAPNTPFMTINNQFMYIYPTTELSIQSEAFSISALGILTSTWRIRNTTSNPADVRWFLLGNKGAPVTASEGTISITAAGTAGDTVTVDYTSRLESSSLTQFITFGAVSIGGQRLTGSAMREFTNASRTSLPTLSLWGCAALVLVLVFAVLWILKGGGLSA